MGHRPIANEFVGAEGNEGGHRVDERHKARFGEAGGETKHVLLGDTDVEESLRETIGERLDHREAEIARQQQNPLIVFGEIDERTNERAPHLRLTYGATCWSACRYSSSFMGCSAI
jgi:hypothetical protein